MSLSRVQGPATVGPPGARPWEPSAPTQDRLFSDLDPLPGSSRATQQPPQQRASGSSGQGQSSQAPSSSGYPQLNASYPNQPMHGPPMAASKQQPTPTSAPSQSAMLPMQADNGQDSWQTFPTSAAPQPLQSERQWSQQQQQVYQPATQPMPATPEMTAEERERQYMLPAREAVSGAAACTSTSH